MSQPKLGDKVLWYPQGDRNNGGNVALVVAVGSDAVMLAAFVPGSSSIKATDWIRHIDDPYYKTHKFVLDNHGAWDWLDPMDAQVLEDMSQTETDEEALVDEVPDNSTKSGTLRRTRGRRVKTAGK